MSSKRSSGSSSTSSKPKKRSPPEELFGSEVDIKVRSATGNPRVEQHFGSEVDLKLRTSHDPFNLGEDDDDVGLPKKVDLEALEAKADKDATQPESIRRLEQKLEEVMTWIEDPGTIPRTLGGSWRCSGIIRKAKLLKK